jgi:hypothetical protein
MKINNATPKNDAICLITDKCTEKRPPFKQESALLFFLTCGAGGVIQPEATLCYRETCLHTTVSSLQNRHGIQFMRKYDPAAKYRRPFMRYWIADEKSIRNAFNLLNKLRIRRNVPPIDIKRLKDFHQ